MTAILAVARLDLAIVRTYLMGLAALLLSGSLLAYMNGPLTAPLFFTLIGTIVASYPFSVGEKDRIDLLLASMPVRRKSIVIGRYLSALASFAALLALGIAAAVLIRAVKGDSGVTGADLAGTAVACFVVYTLMITVQFPLYFRYGYAKARLVALLPLFAIGAFAGIALSVPNSGDLIGMGVAAFTPLGQVLASLAVIALLALSISWTARSYARRDV